MDDDFENIVKNPLEERAASLCASTAQIQTTMQANLSQINLC